MRDPQEHFSANAIPSGQPPVPHDRYTELCALATTGTLTDAEWRLLKTHVLECADCARAMHEFGEIARTAMPLLIPDSTIGEPDGQDAWSPGQAREELLARLGRGDAHGWQEAKSDRPAVGIRSTALLRAPVSRVRQLLFVAAGIVLAAGLATAGYRLGWKNAASTSSNSASETEAIRRQIAALQDEKDSLDTSLQAKNVEVKNLSSKVEEANAELAKLRAMQTGTESIVNRQASELADASAQKSLLVSERDGLARRLEEAESTATSLKAALDHLRQERAADQIHMASLETQVDGLTTRLKQKEEPAPTDAQLLASDRDIRELMGARELYIADVFDVAPDSSTQKPYGRIFYTRGKSLIFYAFDLDKQRSVRNASTYQAWGSRGPHDDRPLNMGIFYLDSDANRRWVLKFDNPEALAEINNVFVTVEPRGGSQEPRGKPLLMASLKSQPNHP